MSRKTKIGFWLATVMMIAGTSLITLGGANPAPVQGQDHSGSIAAVDAMSDAFAYVANQTSPAVVFIEIQKTVTPRPASFFGPEGYSFGIPGFFGPMPGRGPDSMGDDGPGRYPVPVGEGSGFIISPDGYIVTNNHVTDDADRLKVTLADGRTFDAKLVGADPQTEIALIKVEAENLPTVKLGDSDSLRVGEWVLAIGSPFGLNHSVTSGIVSARERGNVGIVDYADFIQTDAAINPGNSGGPLLNMKGEVVGMNTAIVSRGGGSNGVGFAIPVNMVKSVVDQLRDHGSVTRGFLGVGIQELTPDLAQWFGIPDNRGVLISQVSPDSPAEKAGLQRDDVIVEMDGKSVAEAGTFRSHIATKKPGTSVELGILRKGERINKKVDLGSLEGKKIAANEPDTQSGQMGLGIELQPLTSDIAQQLGFEGESGVVVAGVEPGSPAARAGLRPGALITEVNKKPVHNIREFQQALKDGANGKSALLLVRMGEGSRYVAIETS
ncbi:MAG: DegQ family serine endoprotease [Candidatus Hydrogenedentes bacterium]|nr:DegQ family serine endoprotease [Candidatus Hydrogenedentota bacterium]